MRTTADRALPVELQDVMIRDADDLAPAFEQVTLHAGHAVFATHADRLARLVH
ncbi:hypothetical protein [Amycolatopsis thermoflava]|uniref:hypothetical protein n=1 Tax=Amycolatopsis thermoflava TaxID=84480 RepID=UPI003EB8DC16